MPWSSPRSSGWRATDWIIEPKMLPMPTPAPSAPRPTPSARPIAFPAFSTSPDVAARRVVTVPPLVLGLDRRADVDGGQRREDERLDPDDDHDFEEVERGREDHNRREKQALENEHQADEGENQDVPGEHVREQTHGERDQAHELSQDLEWDDQQEQRLRRFGDPTLEVTPRAVPADALEMREEKREDGERERDRERRRRGVDSPHGNTVPRVTGER